MVLYLTCFTLGWVELLGLDFGLNFASLRFSNWLAFNLFGLYKL